MHNIPTTLKKIRELELRYHRPPHSVSLLAVSKKQPIEKIQLAIDAGQKSFGENYLQEALPKILHFSHLPLEWHFIGPIQSNKTREIATHFAWVHSVTSKRILMRLNDQRPKDKPPLNICLQLNLSEEKTKSGTSVEEVNDLVKYCQTLPYIKLRGLMTMPNPKTLPAEQRAVFKKCYDIFLALNQKGANLDTLSMGMSEDLELAIAEGATIVRIGTAIFGPRI